jgi:microcystin degradation protein MlrC
MRIALGGLFHETNGLVRGSTSLADFKAYQFASGSDLLAYRSTRCEIGGFLVGAERLGWDPMPSLFAAALPGGPVDHGAFETLVQRLVEGTTEDPRPDGVLICLHGAMATTECSDADGELLRRLAEALGPDVPVVATVDFHANTSDLMTHHVDALLGYDTYPHVDMFDRGLEATSVLADILRAGNRRAVAHRKVGLVTPPQVQYTNLAPMRTIMERLREVESSNDAVVSVTPGFPYGDVDCMGLSVTASSADSSSAEQIANAITNDVAALSEDFSFSAFSVEEAVDRALAAEGPVVLVDSADNVGGGGPGDGTAILQEWLRRGRPGLIVALTDPVAVATCVAAGIGGRVSLTVGARTDDRHGSPVELSGTVRLLGDGRYVHRGSYAAGITTQMGQSAVVESAGNTIVLTERRVMPFDAQQLLSLGVSPAYCQALVVKSAVAWRAAYGEFARQVIEVDAPGICTANLHRLGLSEQHAQMIRPRSILSSRQSCVSP